MPNDYLIDRLAIEGLYIRYCDLVDSKRFDELADVFMDEATGDYTQALGPGVISPNLASLVASMHLNLGKGSNCGTTHHNVGNFSIEIDGKSASTRVHYYAVHRGINDCAGALYSMWGQYEDRLEKTASGWRVKARVYKCFLSEGPAAVVSASVR
ncbi:nuclear transport factor 2 family protein [Pseudomonas sp. LA21]|nr:nuclear transport factor 2 family protein [Pseudomonas sp. LA21]MCJ1885080.1 nuclear transport factor 2 family protein [Pseudomonas sp. LA21]